MDRQARVLFIVNTVEFFLSHRLPLAIAARKAGLDVHVATGSQVTPEHFNTFGFLHHTVPLARCTYRPLEELWAIRALVNLIRDLRPQLLHLVTLKPVLYGGIIARICGIPSIAAISGMGTVFVSQQPGSALRRYVVRLLYRAALGHRQCRAIVQNSDDRRLLLRWKAIHPSQAHLIRGSGVCLTEFPFVPEPDGSPTVTLAARLLRDKGVLEFIEAARQLKAAGVNATFRLIGSPDPQNPSSVTQGEIDQWAASGLVEILGYRTDIAELFAESHIIVLPSYREGLPKVLMEAAACGRAIITTDVPGCRDAIEPGRTGFLIPARNGSALAKAIGQLIADSDLRRAMGEAGRAMAEREFSVDKIVGEHMQIYQRLLTSKYS